MKKLFFSIAALSLASLAFAQPKTAADVAKFATETIDLGKVKQGVPKPATFTVTNISKDPLIIEQANPTCGCTISDYTKEPIAPGKTGIITATYTAAGVSHFEKTLTVKFAGIDEIKSIKITGDVLSAEDYDKWALENPVKKVETVTPKEKVVAPVKTSKGSKNPKS
ncbi:MAG: DUF1573 domain-containing protein [Sphingobacteriales bacterium]|nr:DUF1573 domain-containing protein [Sphingobacteriales bacterium]